MFPIIFSIRSIFWNIVLSRNIFLFVCDLFSFTPLPSLWWHCGFKFKTLLYVGEDELQQPCCLLPLSSSLVWALIETTLLISSYQTPRHPSFFKPSSRCSSSSVRSRSTVTCLVFPKNSETTLANCLYCVIAFHLSILGLTRLFKKIEDAWQRKCDGSNHTLQ